MMPHTANKRHPTELVLNFHKGRMWGEGKDFVGKFVVEGKYTTEDGKANWQKTYIGKHSVYYNGYNEGKGIWGIWDIPNTLGVNWRGGFHIWPDGINQGGDATLKAAIDMPAEVEEPALMPV